MEYQPQNDYNSNYYPNPEDDEYESSEDTIVKGLKIAIGVLVVLLLALSFLFWNRVRRDKEDAATMKIEMDTLQSQLGTIKGEFETLSFENDSLNKNLDEQRFKADSLLTALKKEKNYRYSIVKKYERELGTLRAAMQGFVRQIDSLNRVNKKLANENVQYRKEMATYKNRAVASEERASELQMQVNRGSVIKVRDIVLKATNKKNRQVSKARTAKNLVVDLVLAANELANPGDKTIYVTIMGPNGGILTTSNQTMNYNGQEIPYTASRVVDYDGTDVPASVYYSSDNISAGQYTVNVYIDNNMAGSRTFILK